MKSLQDLMIVSPSNLLEVTNKNNSKKIALKSPMMDPEVVKVLLSTTTTNVCIKS
jgi:hypothetical protein